VTGVSVHPRADEAVLWIDGWFSTCGACGKQCDPRQETHMVILGYGPENGAPGCGVRFTSIAASRLDISRDDLVRMRPDLELL